LSGGEKSRLALALLVFRRPNLLLLDEPTNHLDLEMRQALAVALQEFAGAMVIVSHDRHLLRVSTDSLLLVHGGRAQEFDGSVDDYPAWLAAMPGDGQAAPERNGADSAAARKARKREEAEQRQRLAPLRKRVEHCEQELGALQAAIAALDARLADASLYEQDNSGLLREALDAQRSNRAAIAAAEERWLNACAELERQQP
jgi:ATP-binding cassette subfamily F protein 3